ncbi:MAG: hypothetical protein M1815_005718 [Lichina confinis]|nr:MAG: hypothetical protein M1815_005718 [Lichina confinis]
MAEALAAIGLTANIAQFIEQGFKLVSAAREIHNSPDGTQPTLVELDWIVAHAAEINDKLANSLPSIGQAGTSPSKFESDITDLVNRCKPIRIKLLALLDSLKVLDKARHRRLSAFRKALKAAVKKNDIAELETRLRRYDEQLSRYGADDAEQSNVLSSLRHVEHSNEETATSSNLRMDQLNRNLVSLKTHLLKTTKEDAILKQLLDHFAALEKEVKQVEKEGRILESLCFNSMKNRHSNIKEAHQRTLDWLFVGENMTFMEWLEKENDIFWVGGKAGSGKSTLMKYVCNHERTLEALRTWSGPSKLIHASYFFWNAGEVLQKSQEGLLKSLLYQILRQCPTMISSVCSQRQVAEPWTRSELFDAVHRLAVQDKWQARFCFFVDSLDEYDGDHLELIDLLRKLAASPYVKLCVSSRPWNAFIDAFDKSKWRLTLQDLTWEDMTAYVADELAGSDMFRRICAEDPRANSLVTQISEKAQGVWLWVYLVVRSLLRGLRGLDDFPLLQKRLDEFPADLMDFFRHMFRRIETVYRKPTARLLQLMVVAKEPLPVAALAFLERESDDPDYALIDPIPPVDASSDGEKWQKRLNQRCTDLVEIDTGSARISYHAKSILPRGWAASLQRRVEAESFPDEVLRKQQEQKEKAAVMSSRGQARCQGQPLQ